MLMQTTEAAAQTLQELWERVGGRVLVRRKAGNSGCMLTKVNITSAPQNLSKLDIRASDNSTVNGQVSKLVSSKSPIPTEQALPMPADDFDRIEAERAKVFSWSEHIDNARSGEQ